MGSSPRSKPDHYPSFSLKGKEGGVHPPPPTLEPFQATYSQFWQNNIAMGEKILHHTPGLLELGVGYHLEDPLNKYPLK